MPKYFSEFRAYDDRTDQEIAKEFRTSGKSIVDLYRTDAVLIRSFDPQNLPENPQRGEIGKEPSRSSLARLVFLLNNCDVPFTSMLTLTMTDQVSRTHDVETHKNGLKAALERLRRMGGDSYCWVREFQNNGSIHWHIFTTRNVGQAGEVNESESKDWSNWFANYYAKKNAKASCVFKMKNGNGKDFKGCSRIEQLQTSAAGLYASKEGAKRYQKKPPKKWEKGGAWWRASRDVTCTCLRTTEVDPSRLSANMVTINGVETDVPFKYQYGLGLKLSEK